jgi:putative membrane protein
MKRLALILGLVGLIAATGMVVYQGAGSVIALFASVGWGLLLIPLYHIVPMAANGRAWQVLLPGERQPSYKFFVWMVWVREGINAMLPVLRVGGEVVGARLMMARGVRTRPAVATLVADMTMSLLSQFAFTMIGLALLVAHSGDWSLTGNIAFGLVIAVPVMAAFGLVQRVGLFGLFARLFRAMFGQRFDRMVGGSAALDRAVRVIYRRPARVFACGFWQLVGWLVSSGEVWIALQFLGYPRSVGDAILITALIEAASSGAFLVPGALGVQEGSYIVLGHVLGLSPEVSLALALVRRARDVLVYGPALALWQIGEGRRLMARA